MTEPSKMPARIWAEDTRDYGAWFERKRDECPVEYVRADIAEQMAEALRALTNAKALSGVRGLVAGWNGEGRDEPYKERHPDRLGATLPKTNCGAVYALDDAMQAAHAALSAWEASNPAILKARQAKPSEARHDQ
jgi:hypothetical protein